MGSSGEWLEQALQDLVGKVETGLQLDADVVSGLVSYCELAPPEDAREYLIEKDNLNQKLKEKEKEEEERRKKKVVMTFDLVGRKVLVNEDEASELKSEHRILRPLENRESNRIRPNPTARLQPIFVDTSSVSKSEKGKQRARLSKGLCLEISGRVQHDSSELQGTVVDGLKDGGPSDRISWERPSFRNNSRVQEDSYECSLDYN
uniref:Serine--tRNA ligase, cytoplasmic n=1 Tax=Anthurium amnicola TaxID=1678845 RepID=A0A1D1YEN3_9ARAE